MNRKISLNRRDLIDWASESAAFCQLDLSRISTIFLAQAYSSEANRIFDTFDLTKSIKVLEGIDKHDGTPPADQFSHPPLTGLYKKHFFSARFLARNLRNFLCSKAGKRHFEIAWEEAKTLSETGYVDEVFVNYLSYKMTIPPIEMRINSNKVTGEWIVFHKHGGSNYYLTLASHLESNDQIYKKVMLACDFDTLPFKI